MSRRALALALLIACVAAPFSAEAQQAARVYRLGFLSMRAGPIDNPQLDAFRAALRELGYVEGRNVVLEVRYAGGDDKKLEASPPSWCASTQTSSSPRAESPPSWSGTRRSRFPS
jgi:hypothetical protein